MTPDLFAVSEDALAGALLGGLTVLIPVAGKWLMAFLAARHDQTRQTRADTLEEMSRYVRTVQADHEAMKAEIRDERAARDRERRESARDREQERKDAEAQNRECEQRSARLEANLARAVTRIQALEERMSQEDIPFLPFDPGPDPSGIHRPLPKPPEGEP